MSHLKDHKSKFFFKTLKLYLGFLKTTVIEEVPASELRPRGSLRPLSSSLDQNCESEVEVNPLTL